MNILHVITSLEIGGAQRLLSDLIPLQAKTDTILFLVVEPHNGTNGKWMLRVAALVSFDRWANSTAVEEFFDTETFETIAPADMHMSLTKKQ